MYALPKPDGPGKPTKEPQPPLTPVPPQILPWGVDRIDAELACAATKGLGVKVAVLDSGIDLNRGDLKDNTKGGVNTVNPRIPRQVPGDYGCLRCQRQ